MISQKLISPKNEYFSNEGKIIEQVTGIVFPENRDFGLFRSWNRKRPTNRLVVEGLTECHF